MADLAMPRIPTNELPDFLRRLAELEEDRKQLYPCLPSMTPKQRFDQATAILEKVGPLINPLIDLRPVTPQRGFEPMTVHEWEIFRRGMYLKLDMESQQWAALDLLNPARKVTRSSTEPPAPLAR